MAREIDYKRYIESLIRKDMSVRRDNYERAKIENSRGQMPADQLADYADDVRIGDDALAFWLGHRHLLGEPL